MSPTSLTCSGSRISAPYTLYCTSTRGCWPARLPSGRQALASLSYLAAFVTEPGESLLDVQPPETAARYRSLATQTQSGPVIPASSQFLGQWGITDPALRER